METFVSIVVADHAEDKLKEGTLTPFSLLKRAAVFREFHFAAILFFHVDRNLSQ